MKIKLFSQVLDGAAECGLRVRLTLEGVGGTQVLEGLTDAAGEVCFDLTPFNFLEGSVWIEGERVERGKMLERTLTYYV